MQTVSVSELRRDFSAVLREVESGHPVAIGYGRRRRRVAVIVPYREYVRTRHERLLGLLSGKAVCRIADDFAMSDEELCDA